MAKPLSSLTALIESNTVVITDIDYWTMHCFDIESKDILWFCNLFQDKPGKLFWNEHILHIKDSYYLTYRNILRVKGLNLTTKTVTNYDTGGELEYDGNYICRVAFENGDDIIILPGDIVAPIWKFNINNHQFIKSVNIYCGVLPTDITEDDRLVTDYYLLNNRFWYINKVFNTLCYLDKRDLSRGELLGDSQVKLQDILSPKKSNEIQSLFINDSLGNIYSFDGKELELFNVDFQLSDISSMFKASDKIVLVPKMDENILIWSENDTEPRIIPMPSEYKHIFKVRLYNGGPARAVIENGKCYLAPFSANGMLILDLIEETVDFVEMEIDDYDKSMILDRPLMICEESNKDLDDFMSKIINDDNKKIVKTKL